jgi:hypothetical protein
MKQYLLGLFLCNILLFQDKLKAQNLNDSKFVLDSGNLNYLKSDTILNFVYVYDNLKVGQFTEPEYVTLRVKEFDKKREGKGEEWRIGWFNDQTTLYPYEFELLLNRSLKKTKKYFHHSKEAKYTLIVKTTYMETGWRAAGPIQKYSYINLELYLVETANTNNVLAKLHGEKIIGIGAIWTTYSNAGTHLGIYLRDNVFIK